MATNPNRFIGLGMPPALALEIAKAIDEAGGSTPPEITVTLTGDVIGTGSGTDTINIETAIAGG